jgi:broad specificity phosphatase PhoE
MRVYYIRHGQSEGNISNRHHAWSQVSLTEKGKQDAAMAGRLLRNVKFDKVYTSDLIRTIQTQKIALPEVESEALYMLREVNVGNLLGRLVEDCVAEYGESYFANRDVTNFAPYGGESREMLQQRIRKFLTMMEQSDYETVAVFGHGTYIQNMVDVVTGQNHDKKQFPCHNGSVTVLEYVDGYWRILAWNCTEFT